MNTVLGIVAIVILGLFLQKGRKEYDLMKCENAFLAGKKGELETELGKVQSQLKVALDKLKEIGIRELKEVKNG